MDTNNIKLFLVDLDGVIVHRADFFSNRAKELYPNANHDTIKEFFIGGAYKETALGHKDLQEALTEVLSSWNVSTSVEEVLQTWFAGEDDVDEVVLQRIKSPEGRSLPPPRGEVPRGGPYLPQSRF